MTEMSKNDMMAQAKAGARGIQHRSKKEEERSRLEGLFNYKNLQLKNSPNIRQLNKKIDKYNLLRNQLQNLDKENKLEQLLQLLNDSSTNYICCCF